jgi:hypothetical protein
MAERDEQLALNKLVNQNPDKDVEMAIEISK